MKKSGPPKDTGKQVDILAKNAGALVKSKPPKWRDFNRFVADFDRLKEYYDELNDNRFGRAEFPWHSTDFDEEDAENCQKLVAGCKANLERFDRRDNYDDPNDDESPLSQEHIAKRITVMVASFPNANPSSPEGYMQMLIEHVSAVEGLTEVALESACREIVETQKFTPAISEVMPIVNEHVEQWSGRRFMLHHVERTRLETIKALVEREEKQQKAAHEQEIEKARWKVEQEIEKARREVQSATGQIKALAKEIDDAKAAIEQDNVWLADAIKRHAEAEKRESEANSKLQALLAQEDESKGRA